MFHSQLFHLPATRTFLPSSMQRNWCFWYPCTEESCDSHYAGNATANSASIDITSAFAYTDTSAGLQEWSPAVTPITENRSGSLTTPSGLTENFGYLAHAASNHALSVPLTSSEYTAEARSRPWHSAAEAMTTHAYTPPAAWKNERRLGPTRLRRSQVPSELTDMDTLRPWWWQCGDVRHAVEALAQPTLQRNSQCFRQPAPDWSHLSALPEVSASSLTSRADIAGLGNAGPCVADPAPWQATSPSNRRPHRRRSRTRGEHEMCDTCYKVLRRQSLKRHIREVHHGIKRPQPKSSSTAQTGPLVPP